MGFGIEKLAVEPCTLRVDMRELVEARGGKVEDVCDAMMIDCRSYNPPWEDPVTMAVNAGQRMLSPKDLEEIELLLVATESGLDQEKSISTWIHRYLGLSEACRNFEIKHACYAGMGALDLACSWLAARAGSGGGKALVITTDESRPHFHRPYEFVMGAGAVAMLVSNQPDFLQLEPGLSGFHTHEVADLTRPTSRVEAGHSETSLLAYLSGLEHSFARYAGLLAEADALVNSQALRYWLPYQVYHAPFGGITFRAHRQIWRTLADYDARRCRADFDTRIAPTLQYNRQMGGTYASSVFISLLGCAAAFGSEVVERRVGMYAYGSGSSAEFRSACFGPRAPAIARDLAVADSLAQRVDLGVGGYERAELERRARVDDGQFRVSSTGFASLYQDHYAGRGRLVLRGVDDFEREYAWS